MYIQKDQYLCCLVLLKKKVNEEKEIEKHRKSLHCSHLENGGHLQMRKSECLFCVIVNRLKGLKIFSAVQDQFIRSSFQRKYVVMVHWMRRQEQLGCWDVASLQ